MNTNLRRAALASVTVLALTLGVTACEGDGTSKTSAAQKQGNADNNTIATKFDAAVPYPYRNANPSSALERENLAKRLIQLNSKGSTGYVYLLAPNTAQVVGYYVISGKVSSTDSAMTSTQVVQNCSGDVHGGSCSVTDSIGDDGTYGPSEGGDNGIFFFTTSGVLVETVMPWIYSSQPLKVYANAPMLDAK